VGEQVNTSLKPDTPFIARRNELLQQRADNAEPLYAKAYEQYPLVKSPALMDMLDTDAGQKAYKEALKAFSNKPGAVTIGPPDATGMSRTFSLEFLDEVKRQFGDIIGKAKTSGKNAKARDVQGLLSRFRDELDTATTNPKTGYSPYKEARSQYEDDTKLIDALDYGKEDFMKESPGDLADKVKDMSFMEKDALRTGVAENLFRQIGGPSGETNPARKIANSPDTMDRLKLLFDKPHEYDIFKEALEAEEDMFNQTRGTLSAGKKARGEYTPPDSIVHSLAKHAPALGVFSPTYWALKRLRSQSKISDKEASQVIDVLRTRDPAVIADNLGRKFGRLERRKKFAGKVGLGAAAIGAVAPWFMQGESGEGEPPEKTEEPDANDPALQGLSAEERVAAQKPAMKKGGRVNHTRSISRSLQTSAMPDKLSQLVAKYS
jgi:hypothetical protein